MKQSGKKHGLFGRIAASGLLAASICCTAVGVGLLNIGTATADEGVTVIADSNLFTTATGVSYTGDTFGSDSGKSGLQIKTKGSGDAAEGAGFTFAQSFDGNFEMDFRVQSQKTYAHPDVTAGYPHYLASGNNKQKYTLEDELNPYADVQQLEITFTSKFDASKYFTVFIRGGDAGVAFAASAGVYVPGDEIFATDLQGNKQYGYGLTYQWDYINSVNTEFTYFQESNGSLTKEYGINSLHNYNNWLTPLHGTSFSNFTTLGSSDSTAKPTTSNLVKFDAENMKVYVNAGKKGNTYSTLNTTADVLVRDIGANNGFRVHKNGSNSELADNQRPVALGSLSSEDFADGYTVSVKFSDITSNDTTGDSSVFGGAGQYPTIIDPAYDRYANLLLYSVNGESVTGVKDVPTRKASQFVTVTDSTKLSAIDNTANAYDGDKGLLITSEGNSANAHGEALENTGFTFNDTMVGEFSTSFRITSEKQYQSTKKGWDTHYVRDGRQDTIYNDAYNPYQDVREVGLTFTSVSNPDKRFTVYLAGAVQSYAYAVSARVSIYGDTLNEAKLTGEDGITHYGYGLDEGGKWSAARDNTWLFGTSFSNCNINSSGTTIEALANSIRFDPVEMKVYAGGTLGGDYGRSTMTEKLVRDLTTNAGVWDGDEYALRVFKTLSAEDFAGGYTVSVAFTDMTSSDFLCPTWTSNGSTYTTPDNAYVSYSAHYQDYGAAYDRHVNMTIYSLNGVSFASERADNVVEATDDRPVVTTAISGINPFVENDITPVYYDKYEGNVAVDGIVSVSTDNVSFTPVQAVEGRYLWKPSGVNNNYYVRYENFSNGRGMYAATKTLTFANDATAYTLTVNGASTTVYKGQTLDLTTYTEAHVAPTGKTLIGWQFNSSQDVYSLGYDWTVADSDAQNGAITLNPVYTTLKMSHGASIRMAKNGQGNYDTAQSGIRFIATIDEAEEEFFEQISVSFKITMHDTNGDVSQTKGVTNVIADEGKLIMSAAVMGITADYYETEWTGELLVTYAYADGEQQLDSSLFADDNTRSIQEVANAAYNDRKAVSTEEGGYTVDVSGTDYAIENKNFSCYSKAQLALLKVYAGI